MAEADSVEVQGQQLLQGAHSRAGTLGNAGGRRVEPPSKLVLQGVAYYNCSLLRQIEGNAAGGVTWQMHNPDLGGEGYKVSVLETLAYGN